MNKPTDEEIFAGLKEAIIECTIPEPDHDKIRPETELLDLNLRDARKGDPFSHKLSHIINLAEVIMDLENRFSLKDEIDIEELFNLWTVADIFECLKKKI